MFIQRWALTHISSRDVQPLVTKRVSQAHVETAVSDSQSDLNGWFENKYEDSSIKNL